jgi:hypothetical protein
MAEPEVMREQLQWQQRMQKQEAEFAARLENAQRASISAVGTTLDPHMKHISDELILPRCPKQSCRRFIPDFEGCAALQVLLLECHSPVQLRHQIVCALTLSPQFSCYSAAACPGRAT